MPGVGIVLLKMDLLLGELEEVVGPFLDVMIDSDKKSAGAGGGVLDKFARSRLHKAYDGIDERTGRKMLACAGFLLGGVFLQKPFIKIAESLFARRKPIELVDRVSEGLKVGRLAQHRSRIHKNRGNSRLAFRAKVEKQALVIIELFEPVALGQLAPAIAVRQRVLAAGFGLRKNRKGSSVTYSL